MTNSRPIEPLAVTTEVAAAQLAVSPGTIREMIHDGRLPAINIGREYRIPVAEIRALIERASAPRGK